MYKRGELTVEGPMNDADPDDENGVTDSRPGDGGDYSTRGNVAWLPHSCGKWVVGGVVEIKALIADLEAARSQLENS